MAMTKPALAALLGLLATGSSLAEEISLYTWEEYLAPQVLTAFTRETGHTVKQFYYDNEDERDNVIASGRASSFDLMILDDLSLRTEDKDTFYATVPDEGIPNRKHLGERWQHACGARGIAYGWGTTGIAYRSSISPVPIVSWKQLFSPPAEHKGGIVMMSETISTVDTALMAADLPPFSMDKAHLKEAFALLEMQQPQVLSYDYGVSYASEQGSKSRMTMALAYSGDVEQIAENTAQEDWRYVVPEEGTLLWLDCLAAPKGHKAYGKAALAFLDFLNRPDIAALNAETSWFSTPNDAALALTSEEYRKDEELFPPPSVLNKSQVYQTVGAEGLSLRDRMLKKLRAVSNSKK